MVGYILKNLPPSWSERINTKEWQENKHTQKWWLLIFPWKQKSFHLISSWCLHYWAISAAHTTACCCRAICWRIGSGSNITDIFHASCWCWQLSSWRTLSYFSQGLEWQGKSYQQQQQYILCWSKPFQVCDGCGFSAQGRKNVHSKYNDKEDMWSDINADMITASSTN